MPPIEPRTQPLLIHVIVTPSLLKRIEDFQFDHRIRTRADAVRTLIVQGLNQEPKL